MDGMEQEIFFEDDIKLQLDGIDKIIKTQDKNHLLAVYPVIERIKEAVSSSLYSLSQPVTSRIHKVYDRVLSLLSWCEEEIEETFFQIWDTELLVTWWWIIVFLWEQIHLVTCDSKELRIIELLIEQKNSLNIKPQNLKILQKHMQILNQKFNSFGVFFGIEDNIFLCSNNSFYSLPQENLKNQETNRREQYSNPENNIREIHSNTIYFGVNWTKAVKFENF